jgi:uroporphyrinogen III methyltransferase / synthase
VAASGDLLENREAAVNEQSERGIVYLVGAGPGDPGLITVRGRELLERAEVVVYDALANPELLSYCPRAELIYVGKRAAAHAMTQEQINAVLVEQGQRGRRVVRLKGGDPYVFGRGGEEGLALHAAGVAFEEVPGITAAIAAPAYAGIPVTHRDFNSSFTLLTGHEKEQQYQDPQAQQRGGGEASDIEWSAIARLPCVAFYMGIKSLPRICRSLIAHGMSPEMPAASIQWGTTPRQRTVTGTVADLPQRVEEAGITPPALTIIGRVVSLREMLNWFERRPLFGQTVVVTRTRQQASDLSSRLRELGARVIEAPTIELHPADPARVTAALRDAAAGRYDWIILTSVNGVTHMRQGMPGAGLDARALAGTKVAAIGEATAAAVQRELCIRPDLVPQRAVAEALADELAARGEIAGRRFLLLRADIGRPVLVERLGAGGAAAVDDVAVYETRPAAELPQAVPDALQAGEVDWVTFTSSSTASNLARLLGEDYRSRLEGIRLASIGPVTTATLRELGLEPSVEADPATIRGLVEAILRANRG